MTAADAKENADRQDAFVAVVRARLLRLRLRTTCRRTSWLLARTRYLMKPWPADGTRFRPRHGVPGARPRAYLHARRPRADLHALNPRSDGGCSRSAHECRDDAEQFINSVARGLRRCSGRTAARGAQDAKEAGGTAMRRRRPQSSRRAGAPLVAARPRQPERRRRTGRPPSHHRGSWRVRRPRPQGGRPERPERVRAPRA